MSTAKESKNVLIEVIQFSHLSLMTVAPHSAGSYWASGALSLLLIGSCTVGRYLQLLACGYGMMEHKREQWNSEESNDVAGERERMKETR